MKVLHVCFADSHEGGAIGAYRLHSAMRASGVDSHFLAIRKRTEDENVITPPIFTRALIRFWNLLAIRLLRLQKPGDRNYRSLNVFPTGVHRIINSFEPDVVQCHWINRNSISIFELAKIKAPLFMKLPDMWAFSGTEHYISPGAIERYKEGYTSTNRQEGDRGLDIDRFVWNLKRRAWKNVDITVVTPSRWLGDCARESALFGNYRIENIANPIDLDFYQPFHDKRDARIVLGLPQDKNLVLFGSVKADTDPRKGFTHLREALNEIQNAKSEIGEFEFLIFGTSEKKKEIIDGVVTHYLGTIFDERVLMSMYCAADVMVLPTVADNLPNTVQEATSCGTPCVGFRIGGMPDMITHKETGYLAEPFDPQDLADGIKWVLGNKGETLTRRVRQNALKIFDPKSRVNEYLDLYSQVLKGKAGVP